MSGYGRQHELEADRLGAEYLARTGYDPDKMLGVVGILKDQEEFELQRARKKVVSRGYIMVFMHLILKMMIVFRKLFVLQINLKIRMPDKLIQKRFLS